MKLHPPVPIFSRGNILIATFLVALIIHSCRKDGKSDPQTSPAIVAAKTWYEAAYPVNSANGKLVTQSTGGSLDLSQLIKPDWQHAESYIAGNKNVIEIPVNPAAKFNSTVKIGNRVLNKAYSRSYYLLLNDGKKYEAYILTIFADSAYVKNDLSKLAHNTYRKQDADFSGLAIYFTPKGDYLGGYAYKNGQLVTPATTTQQTGGQKTQSVSNGNLKPDNMVETCEDWYQQITIYYQDGTSTVGPWTFWGTVCTSSVDGGGGSGTSGGGTGGGGGGGGGTSSSTPPPPCPPGTTIGIPTTSPCVMPLSTIDAINNGKLKIDYMPLPGTSTPCSVSTTPVPCFTIKLDSLTKYFPCAAILIIEKLTQLKGYGQFAEPFLGSRMPDLSWANANLAWNPNGGGQTMLANTLASGKVGLSSVITLNNKMLQNSSQLIIAAAAIHETIHAYINFDVTQNTVNQQPNFKINGNWLYGLDIFYNQNALPSNYRDHYEMLSDYFAQAVNILAQWDNNAHTQQQYAMAMLFGMDTAFLDPSNPANASEINQLNTEYQKIKTAYLITDDTALNDYWRSQLTASAADKLPNNCQ